MEDEARKQLANAARLPIVFKHIAAMPDVHLGIGATVGSVIPTVKAIIPAAVGVGPRLSGRSLACSVVLQAIIPQPMSDKGVIDEIPMAYKDIDAVMDAQKDLVEVVHTLKLVVCVNG